jgi:hypothetical protein
VFFSEFPATEPTFGCFLIDYFYQLKNPMQIAVILSRIVARLSGSGAPPCGHFHEFMGPSVPVLYKTRAFTLRKGISVLPPTRVTIGKIRHG